MDMLGVYPDAVSLVPQVLLALAPLLIMAVKRKARAAELAGASSRG